VLRGSDRCTRVKFFNIYFVSVVFPIKFLAM